MEQIYIVDRIEGDYFVIESPNGEIIDVSKDKIKGYAKDGDCLILKNNYFFIDKEATLKRKEEIARKMEGMWQD
ncbi:MULTISPECIES: DUF3006 domain-containing protein [Clostridium]|uniref:DUF3006 domain-containing protein n=1 Tax=Clostridium cibarium TaxID=2762247 RepID=A0ABR8PUH2_9CLOT|nr:MULTISPECIES: DUF3006 domain-containing protein [Clostridium]MBD7911820.1 DUF3006 domain-containing protein [Clostridium cibarium]